MSSARYKQKYYRSWCIKGRFLSCDLRPSFFIWIYNYERWRRTVPNPLEKEPQGRGILFVPFNVSIPSNVSIIYLVHVGFEIRRNENARDVNTQVVFNYGLWRLWIMQCLSRNKLCAQIVITEKRELMHRTCTAHCESYLRRQVVSRCIMKQEKMIWLNTYSKQRSSGENA